MNKPFYGSEMLYKVADLRLEDLTIEKDIDSSELKDRYLSFFLTGPKTLWTVYEIGEVSFTCEEKIEVKNSLIYLNEQFPFKAGYCSFERLVPLSFSCHRPKITNPISLSQVPL